MKNLICIPLLSMMILNCTRLKPQAHVSCPESIIKINMCGRFDTARYLIYELNYTQYLKQTGENILQCQLFGGTPNIMGDTMVFSFLITKNEKQVYFMNCVNTLYFEKDSLKLLGVDDGAFMDPYKNMFKLEDEFAREIRKNESLMSDEFREVLYNVQHPSVLNNGKSSPQK